MPGVLAALGVPGGDRPARTGHRARWPTCDRWPSCCVDGLGHHLLAAGRRRTRPCWPSSPAAACRVVGPRHHDGVPVNHPDQPGQSRHRRRPGRARPGRLLPQRARARIGCSTTSTGPTTRTRCAGSRWPPSSTVAARGRRDGARGGPPEPGRQRADHGRLPGRALRPGRPGRRHGRRGCSTGLRGPRPDGGLRLPGPTWTRPATCSASALQSGRRPYGCSTRCSTVLIGELPPRSALVVTADHGQVNVPATTGSTSTSTRACSAGLRVVAGEPRVRYLHTLAGRPRRRHRRLARGARRRGLGRAAGAGGRRGLVRPGGRAASAAHR